ncbi:solute carrier family 26 member 10-like isoform X1 [Argonauta hians]
MGLIVRLMPDSLVSGFSTGIAIYILSSQLKYILGVEVESFSGVFSIPKSLWATMKQLPDTNYPELLLSLISMVIIFLVKVHINDRFMSCLIAPIPIDLLIVILSTVVSAVLQLHEKHNFSITGDIPRGFPIPVIPDLNYADGYIGESVIIGIIGFAQSVSVAVVIARREGYTIDPNKELIAYGIMNVISPIFTCFAAAGALARSGVQHSSGGRTQIASIVGCIFVVLVVLAVGPLLRALPNCVLSAIIMVSLWPMFREIGNLRSLWRISPYECYIWIGTFFGVIFTTVELGLVIGMVIGGATIIIRTQMVNFNRISVIEHTELFRNEFCYNVITPQCPVIILSFNSPLYYANVDAFQTRFKAKFTEFSKIQIDYETHIQCTCRGNGRRYIILDFSAISFVDAMGAKTLQQIFIDAKSEGITCIYTWLNEDVVMALEGADVYETFEDYCYVTTYDAVIAIQKGLVLPIREESDDEEKMVFRKRKTTLAEILAP